MTITLNQLGEKIRASVQAAQAAHPQPWHSFWQFRLNENFPPPKTEEPAAYDGTGRLNIACTQTDLSARDQKALVSRWCKALPQLSSVRYLWFNSRVPQELFDAACAVPNLEGLYVKWSGIETIAALATAPALKYFHLGSSASLNSIEPLSELKQLRWLELENIKRITDLNPVQDLINLDGFSFVGTDGGKSTIKTFAPLANLRELKWLHLGAIRAEDESLRPLSELQKLRWLGMGNFFSYEEFAWLSTQLPADICSWFQPFKDLGDSGIKCKKCNNGMVMLTGKAKGIICPDCNKEKFQRHIATYREAASAAC